MAKLKHGKKNRIKEIKYLTQFITALFFIFIVFFSIVRINGEDDIYWHMQTGKYIVETKSVPSADVFGYVTQGTNWIPFEWLWDSGTYLLYSAGGFAALYARNSIFLILIFLIIFSVFKKAKIKPEISILLMLLIYFGVFYRIGIKPQMPAYLFLVFVLKLLIDYRYSGSNVKNLFFIIPVFLLWANVHMSIFLGAGLLGAFYFDLLIQKFIMQKEVKNLLLIFGIFIASAAVTLINPHGINTFLYAYDHTKMKMLEEVYEWMSPFSANYFGKVFNIIFIIFLLGGVSLIIKSIRKRDFFIIFSVLIFMHFAVRALRFTVDYIFIAGIFFGVVYAADFSRVKLNKPYLKYASAVILVFFIFLTPGGSLHKFLGFPKAFGAGLYEDTFPVKMYDFMKANNVTSLGLHPFQTFEYGGYFIWNFPESKNFIDSRNLNDSIWNDFITIFNKKEGYRNLIQQDSIDYFMITRPTLTFGPEELKTTIISYLSQNTDEWKLVYWDDISQLYVKNNDSFKDLTGKYEFSYLTPYNIIFKLDAINSGINQNPEKVQSEINRKRAEGSGTLFMNQFYKVFSQRTKQIQ